MPNEPMEKPRIPELNLEVGWGRPVNKAKTDKIHWWNSDDRTACSTKESITGFSGDRHSAKTVMIYEACPECLDMVRKIFGDLGKLNQ